MIRNIVSELNAKNKELVKEMDNLGFTSLGHKAEYYFKGRTIYKNEYANHSVKVGVVIKANAETIKDELIEKEIHSVIEYFKNAKANNTIQEKVFQNKAELALALMKGEKWRVKGTNEGYCFYEESNVLNDTKIPFRFGTSLKSVELDGWWESANNIDVWEKIA
jgi:thioesterase domain-containing protein